MRSNRVWRRGTDGLGQAQMFGGKETRVHSVQSTSATILKSPADFRWGLRQATRESDQASLYGQKYQSNHFSCELRQICSPSGELLVTSAAQPSDILAKITTVRIRAQHKFCLHFSHMPSLNTLSSLLSKVRTKDWSRVNWKS